MVITQGEKKRGAYLFEPLTEEVKEKLKELKPLRTAKPDYQFSKFRNLVTIFAKASEDYNKFGFSKDALVLTRAADSLNSALIQEFTSKPLGLLKRGKASVSFLDDAMSKDDVNKLRQFIEDTPQIKNVLSITFDPTGKNGTYFKPRNLNGQTRKRTGILIDFGASSASIATVIAPDLSKVAPVWMSLQIL